MGFLTFTLPSDSCFLFPLEQDFFLKENFNFLARGLMSLCLNHKPTSLLIFLQRRLMRYKQRNRL